MLRIWTGRARSGKSNEVMESIRALGDSSKQILIVPQYATHEAEMELCRVCGDTAARHGSVVSFESLARSVLEIVGGGADVELDSGGKLLTMQRTLQEVGPKLCYFRRSFLKSAFLTGLVSLADEFRSYRVTPELLLQQAEYVGGETEKKLRDLALIIGWYEVKLTEGGMDARDRVTRMAERLEESGYVCGKDVFLDGFSYFNAQEERALAVMLRQCRSVTVALLHDGNDISGIFHETNATIGRLQRLAEECGQEVELCSFPCEESDTPLAFLEKAFFETGSVYDGECGTAVSVISAPSVHAEAEAVAAEIRRLTMAGYRYRDIGVAVRNVGDYQGVIETVFRRYGIPCFMDGRSDILDKPLMTLITSVLEAVSNGYEYEDMFQWLKSGLAPVSDEECDLLENYVIRWEIRGGMWIRETDWTAHPDGYGATWTEAAEKRLKRINKLRRQVREPLAALAEGMKQAVLSRDMVAAVYRFLEQLQIPEKMDRRVLQLQQSGDLQTAEEYSQLWNILVGVMDQFVEILGDCELDRTEFSRLFRLLLTQYSVDSIPVALDQVKLSSIVQNERKSVRCLFIMGANDGVIPSVAGSVGLLTEEERERISAGGIRLAPGADSAFAMELQSLYATLAQPTERLVVSYPRADASGAELQPAFLVTRLRDMFRDITVHEPDFADITAAPLPALQTAGSWQGGKLWKHFEKKEEYSETMRAMERATSVERGALSKEAVQLLYGTNIRMSASRVDKLRQCHYAYFMQYGLKAKARRTASFDAPEIGTFLHYLLENVTKEVQKKGGFSVVDEKELHRLTRHYTDLYAKEELDDLREKNARFCYLFRRLCATAEQIVDNLAEEMRQSDFVPRAFELEFSDQGDIPAICISEGEHTLQLGGKVDRVDGWLHDGKMYLRVVDYKTGRKAFDLADVRYGLNLQMLLYLFTLQQKGEEYFGHPIEPAGVLYMPARTELLKQRRDISKEDLQFVFQKEMTRSGLVLADPLVLRAMEHSALESPCYLPLRVNRNGNLSGSIASAEELGALARHVDRQLHEILREMAAGTVDADPSCRSESDTPCRYCEFSSACHFEEGRGSDRLRYIRPVGVEEFWEEIKGKGEEN